jgi:hypothetical protein
LRKGLVPCKSDAFATSLLKKEKKRLFQFYKVPFHFADFMGLLHTKN